MERTMWNKMLDELAPEISHSLAGALRSSQIYLQNGAFRYTLGAFALKMLQQNGREEKLESAIRSCLGPDTTITHEVREISMAEIAKAADVDPARIRRLQQPVQLPMNYFVREGLKPEYCDETNWLIDDWNVMAQDAMDQLISGKEQIVCIVAPTGMGKTQLAQLTLHRLQEQGLIVEYVPASTYFANAVSSMDKRAGNRTTADLGFYLQSDVLCFDSIEYLASRLSTNSFDCFKVTLETLLARDGKRLILVSHNLPISYGFTDDVFGKIMMGLTVPIDRPNELERQRLLQFMALKLEERHIPDEVLLEMAKFSFDPRTLDGVLKSLDHQYKFGPPRDGVGSWIAERYGGTGSLSVQSILKAVSAVTGLDEQKIKEGTKTDQSRARHIAMYLIDKLLSNMSESAIGRVFDQKPSTAHCGIEVIEQKLAKKDVGVMTLIHEIKRELKIPAE